LTPQHELSVSGVIIRAICTDTSIRGTPAVTPSPKSITELLIEWQDGDEKALDRLMPLVHEELRRMAHRYLRRERPGHSFQSSDLVNEAYIRLVDRKGLRWQNRAHFYGVAAQAMRRILVDHARARITQKRGGREKCDRSRGYSCQTSNAGR
jgi:RNA polymerase sigma factor (TIGR02999 family)